MHRCIIDLHSMTAEKHTPSLYTQNTSHLPNSAFHNIESIGSVRGFRARFASQLVQFGASERVSRVNWFSSGLQSAFRESIGSVRGFRARFRESIGSVRGFRAHFASQLVQFGASERISRVNWFSSGLQSALHTHTHTLSLSLSHTLTLSLSHSLSLSHTHSHTLTHHKSTL